MTTKIHRDVARAICQKIMDENSRRPYTPQAMRCRACEACSKGSVIKTRTGGRACCLVSQRFAKVVSVGV